MKEGDIYSWRWRDDDRHADCAPYRSYHCKSRLAVVRNGTLFDTYWFGYDQNSMLRPDDVILTLLGNASDMSKIRSWDVAYYKPADVVDMRHSNNSSGPIYLKSGATRDRNAMLTTAVARREEAISQRDSAAREIERMDEIVKLIEINALDKVYF